MLWSKHLRRRIPERGFTLLELVAVTIILAILAGGAVLGITASVKKAKRNATISQIATLGAALDSFHLDCGFYPPSLEDLVRAPTSGRACKGYPPEGYLKKKEIPEDPWANRYGYAAPGTHSPESYDLWSFGPDGEDGTSDDITSWASAAEEGD